MEMYAANCLHNLQANSFNKENNLRFALITYNKRLECLENCNDIEHYFTKENVAKGIVSLGQHNFTRLSLKIRIGSRLSLKTRICWILKQIKDRYILCLTKNIKEWPLCGNGFKYVLCYS